MFEINNTNQQETTASFLYSLDQLSKLGLSKVKVQEYIKKDYLPIKDIKLNGRYKVYESKLNKQEIKQLIIKQKKLNYSNCGRAKNSIK